MGIMDTLKGLIGGKKDLVTDKANDAIDATAGKVDDATGGKLGDAVDTGAEKAKDAVTDVVDKVEE